MKASDQVKRAALNKTVNYLLEDPERNITKIMDMLDKVAPTDLFPSQRIAFRNAIERKNNPLSHRLRDASSPEGRAFIEKGNFPIQRKSSPFRGSWMRVK